MGFSKGKSRSISDRSQLLLDRFHQALELGIWNGGKWQCTDIQGQLQVARSLTGLLDSISKENLPNSLLKGLVFSGVMALVSILEYKNPTVLSIAAKTALRLITVLPIAVLQPYALELVSPLSSLLELHQLAVSILSAKALNLMFSNPALLRNEKEVWEILTRSDMVRHAISDISKVEKMELFKAMASLLSTTLRRWPLSRFPLYSNAVSMGILIDILAKPNSNDKVEVLKLLSSIALCGSGAAKLLENGESFLRRIVTCMESSQPFSVRIEGFRLARRLAINEERFFKMAGLCSEPLVQAIICGMGVADVNLRNFSSEPILLIRKACRLALITRWGGKHHALFWKHGIGFVLLDLLNLEMLQNYSSLEKKLLRVSSLQNYVWDILGWLAIHCEYDFDPERENGSSVDLLIKYACSKFVKATRNNEFCSNDFSREWYPTRAFFMMIYSPCKYIASKAKAKLSELHPHSLRATMSRLQDISLSSIIFRPRHELLVVMAVACFIGSREFQFWVLEFSGLKVLVTLAKRYLEYHEDVETVRESYSSRKKTCCDISLEEGWEGKNLVMFYTLWGLAVLIQDLDCVRNDVDIPELIDFLQDICVRMSGHGVRWFSSYALSYLGLYGFPNKFQKKVGRAIRDTGHEDTRFIFRNGESLSAHGVALAVHCPSLLRLEEKDLESKRSGDIQREIRLSDHVDQQLLLNFLDYVYMGYLQTEGDTKLLRALAKLCNLRPLMQVLRRERPKWGTPYPIFDLSLALGPLGYQFSDVILENETSEVKNWKCNFCSSSVPHFHAHKSILASVCPYMRALFYSNMQESFSQRVKLDLISFEAMAKLVAWFYTNNLSTVASGCVWQYMSDEEKFDELKPYVELCWLSDYWVFEDLKKACLPLVISLLNSAQQLSIKVIKIAVFFNMWDLVDVAKDLAAPLYRQFHDSGELEELDEAIVHMIRSASVQRALETMTAGNQ